MTLADRFVEALLIGGAHEVMARSAWRLEPSAPSHAAAAGGFLAWHRARSAQAAAFATVAGGAIGAAALSLCASWLRLA